MELKDRAIYCRAYPTKTQVTQIDATCNGCRYVWNKALEYCKSAYEMGLPHPNMYEIKRLLPKLKKAEPWLSECESTALQEVIRNLGEAYSRGFNNLKTKHRVTRRKPKHKVNRNTYGFPVYHSRKKHKMSYRITNGNRKRIEIIDKHHIKLPKLGSVKIRGLREFRGEITGVTVTHDKDGKFYVTLHVKCEVFNIPVTPVYGVVGVDLGVKSLATTSEGEVFDNPRALVKHERRIARLQRSVQRKKKNSRSRVKARRKLAREYAKTRDVRSDTCHKVSLTIARDSQMVVCEDLCVKGMLYNHNLAKSIADSGMGMLSRFIEYKCDWYDRLFLRVDRFFPSSKTCHVCGHVNPDLKLSDRVWVCPHCGAVLYRDYNAAINLRDCGLRVILQGVGRGTPEQALISIIANAAGDLAEDQALNCLGIT